MIRIFQLRVTAVRIVVIFDILEGINSGEQSIHDGMETYTEILDVRIDSNRDWVVDTLKRKL